MLCHRQAQSLEANSIALKWLHHCSSCRWKRNTSALTPRSECWAMAWIYSSAFCTSHDNESRAFFPAPWILACNELLSLYVPYNTASLFCSVPAVCPWQAGGRRGSQQLPLACTKRLGWQLLRARQCTEHLGPLGLSMQGTSNWDIC